MSDFSQWFPESQDLNKGHVGGRRNWGLRMSAYLEPERPAVLIGTQDMLLFRALNRGYASGVFPLVGITTA